ncbi:rRNA-processing protein EFG1 [Candida viswanathii]|uniref:rRNA-processing protein EFG1 n=1 Tax=Candida viswanathii TaxID=5486 RepID=A0A367YN62_9ASCO|nr:rRNA-processing protein EFG1 [Candida viswanathii]
MPKTAKKPRHKSRGASIQVAESMGSGSAKIKKKIRDIERLLKKNDKLPADKKIEYDRALKALRVELQNSQVQNKAKVISKKYHMVRFFERKKAVRKLKNLRKEFEEVSKTEVRKDIKKARKQVKHGEIDLAYVILFPKTEKYISLYPSPNDEDQTDPNVIRGLKKTEERRREFRKSVEKLMDEGKLPFSIDDILQGKTVKLDSDKKQKAVITQEIDAPEAKQAEQEQEEDDFFE